MNLSKTQRQHRGGWCSACREWTNSKYYVPSGSKIGIDDYERISFRGFHGDDEEFMFDNMKGAGCHFCRQIRTRAVEFEKNKKFEKIWKKWNEFLEGKRGIRADPVELRKKSKKPRGKLNV